MIGGGKRVATSHISKDSPEGHSDSEEEYGGGRAGPSTSMTRPVGSRKISVPGGAKRTATALKTDNHAQNPFAALQEKPIGPKEVKSSANQLDFDVEMRGLNHSFSDALKRKLERNEASDLRMLFRQYENHLNSIERGRNPTTSTAMMTDDSRAAAHTENATSAPQESKPLAFTFGTSTVSSTKPEVANTHTIAPSSPMKEDQRSAPRKNDLKPKSDHSDEDVVELEGPPSKEVQPQVEKTKPLFPSGATLMPFGQMTTNDAPTFSFGQTATKDMPTLVSFGQTTNKDTLTPSERAKEGTTTANTSGGFSFGTPGTSSFGGFQFNLPSFTTNTNTPFTFPSTTTFGFSGAEKKDKAEEEEEEGIPPEEEASFSGERTNAELIRRGVGEEDEQTLMEQRIKLFSFEKEAGTWKDLGIAIFKVNQSGTGTPDCRCRILARSEGTGRVVLNSWLIQGVQAEHNATGNRNKEVKIFCLNQEGKPSQYLVRCKDVDTAASLATEIRKHLPSM